MKSRTIMYAAVLAILVMFALPSGPAGALLSPPGQASDAAAVTSNALFGGTRALVSEQGTLGRKLAIVRLYDNLGQPFTMSITRQVMSAGSTVLASLDVPLAGPSYASITAGRHDQEILTWLTQADHAAVTYHLSAVYVSFEHEANAPSNRVHGTPAQFVAAWDHIHALAARAHLDGNTGGRLRWVLILEHYAYAPLSQRPRWAQRLGKAADFWPGPAEVNVVAADGYNWGGCKTSGPTSQPTLPAVTPGSIFDALLTWAGVHGKPVFLAEWASAYYPGALGFQPDFIIKMKAYVLAHPQITAAMYYDHRGNGSCRFSVNGHPLSLTALAAMGQVVAGHTGP